MIKRKLDILLIALASILVIAVIAVIVIKKLDGAKNTVEFLAQHRTIDVSEPSVKASSTLSTEPPKAASEKEKPKITEGVIETMADLRQAFNLGVASGLGEVQDLSAKATGGTRVVEGTETENIPFDTIYEYTANLFVGEEAIYQFGVDGQRAVTYEYTYDSGNLLSKREVRSSVLSEAVSQIILLGTTEPEPAEAVVYAPSPAAGQPPAESLPLVSVTEATVAEIPSVTETKDYTTLEDYLNENATEPSEAEPSQNTEPTQIEEVTEPSQQVPLEGVTNLGFQTPGTNGATSTNFAIVQSLLNRNGALSYLSFSNNGNGTITVDGHTFAIESGPILKNTTYYDGYACALITGLENAQFTMNGLPCNGTSMGLMAQRGIVSTSMANGLPYGTVVFVEGYGLGVVGDCGGFGPDTLDLCLDAGECSQNLSGVHTAHRNVYIISIP